MKTPIKISWKSEWMALTMIIASIIASIFFYQKFPAQVPTHWNFAGEIDGYSSREFGAFFFPILNIGMYLMLIFLPSIDPKQERYAEFDRVYHMFKNLIMGVMFIIFMLAGIAGMGYVVPMGIIMPIIIGLLFIIMGNYLGKVKQNWFMGVKTPWTISNEENWNKTNRLAGKLFIISGLLMMSEIFLPGYLKLIVFVISIFLAVIPPFGYSAYLFWKSKK